MKKILIVLSIIFCGSVFGSWHSFDTPPQEGQMHMIVDMCAGVHYTKRQVLIISHYHEIKSAYDFDDNGWWDAEPYHILEWFSQGSKILYLPSDIDQNFVDRMQRFVK